MSYLKSVNEDIERYAEIARSICRRYGALSHVTAKMVSEVAAAISRKQTAPHGVAGAIIEAHLNGSIKL